mmetsp:Transcript_67256/g.186311  ORF Transcript_67256/g.186311 Transcript_67256/m.186311 type:complete len:203 (+) Transcript_67256:150-758(+)
MHGFMRGGEILPAHKVLGHSNGKLQIHHVVPPPVRDIDRLAGLLDEVQAVAGGVRASLRGGGHRLVAEVQPMHGAVSGVGLRDVLQLRRLRLRREEHPALAAADKRVPGSGLQRVHVQGGASALRADEQPAVRRPLLPQRGHEVLREARRADVRLSQRPASNIQEGVIEDVQWAIVALSPGVLAVSLKGHGHRCVGLLVARV